MTGEPSAIGEATLTASGIARLAGVGRAAVSNWRRRYADFPAPVGGTPASPYFSAREVDQWLRRQGKLGEAGTEQWAWRHIETYQPAAQIGDALAIAGAYLLVRSEHPARGGNLLTRTQLVTRLRGIDRGLANQVATVLPDDWTPQLSTVLHLVEQLALERDPEAAFEYLHRQYVSSAQSMSGLAGTPDTVAEVILTLAGSGALTFDFTCGTGSLLRLAAQRALEAGTPTHCCAQEIKPQYALIAAIRLWFVHRRAQRTGHPEAPAPTLHVGDSLLADAFPDLRADTVVANFPFGIHDWGHNDLVYDSRWTYGLPPRTEPELAWVQHALAHLAPGGTAVVLMPPAAAARPAGRRIRAELVRRGALRAVVALPAGLMPPAGIGLHVWVLGQPDAERSPDARILFVDATHSDPPVELIGKAWREFSSGYAGETPGVHRAVPAIELLDGQVDLTPRRHLPHPEERVADAAQTIAWIADLERLLTQVRRNIPRVEAAEAATLRTARRASLADLVRTGGMSVHRVPGSSRAATVGGTRSGAAAVAGEAPQANAGDVVVSTTAEEITAWALSADDAGAPLAPGVHLVRADPDRFDPWFIAGVLTRTGGASAPTRVSRTGSGLSGVDLRRYTIPVLPLAEQRRYGQVFRRLAQFQASLDMTATVGAMLGHEIRSGLTSGTLAPA